MMNVTQRLTWRDMFEIYNIARLYFRELDEGPVENFPDSTREMYEEVLRRYEEWKGGAVEISRRTSPKTTPPATQPRKVILGGKTPSKNETKWKD